MTRYGGVWHGRAVMEKGGDTNGESTTNEKAGVEYDDSPGE